MKLEHTSTGTARDLRSKAARIRDLTPVDPEALKAAVDGNKAVNFDPKHPMSISSVKNGEVVIGSKIRSYGSLLRMPVEDVAGVYLRYVHEVDNG